MAGIRANTIYHMRARIDLSSGRTLFDSDHTFTTGALPQASFPAVTVTPADRLTTGAGVELLSSFGTDVSAVVLDADKEDWRLLIWLVFQRFLYRQLMYYVAIKSTLTAIRGTIVGWGKLERKATVPMGG